MPDNSGDGLRWRGKPLQRGIAEHEAPSRAFEMQPPPRQPTEPRSFLDLAALYGGILAPDALTTEAGFRSPERFRETNPALRAMPGGTAGRAAYFGGSALAAAALHRLLAKKDPRLAALFKAVLAGSQQQMVRDNLELLSRTPARTKEDSQ